jgi:microcystin-dependent protein
MWATGSAPTGWLLCDGSAVSRASFAALFAVIGTTYGTGDGSTTFNLPNMQGKYARMDTAALGAAAGAATHDHDLAGGTPVGAANITIITGPGPNTQIQRITVASYSANFQATTGSSNTTSESNAVTSGAPLQGHTASSSNLPPYLNLNFIIKT